MNKLKHIFITLLLIQSIQPVLCSSEAPEDFALRISQEFRYPLNNKLDIKQIKGIIPADISFMIADLKYNQNELKIVEFGGGIGSGYKVLDHTYGRGRVWRAFWKYLTKFNLPIWFVGNNKAKAHLAWRQFKKIGGKFASSFKGLMNSPHFQKIAQRKNSSSTSIKDYQGIIILKRYTGCIPEEREFIEKYPNFLIANRASKRYTNNKDLTNSLFRDKELKKYRPRAKAYPREWTPDLARTIAKEINSSWYVIKPIKSSCGNGVIILPKRELAKTLRLIIGEYHNHLPYDTSFSFHPYKPLTYSYWKHDRNPQFMVEEYIPSKLIRVNKKRYDATMRIIYVLSHDEGEIRLNFFDAYWKRPVKSIDERGSFREKYVSKHAPNAELSKGLRVKSTDYKHVKRIMRNFLPKLYRNLLVDFHVTPKKFSNE